MASTICLQGVSVYMDIDRNSFSGVVVFFVVSVWNCATFAAIFYDVDCEEVKLADRVNPKRSNVSSIGLSKCSSFKLIYELDPSIRIQVTFS